MPVLHLLSELDPKSQAAKLIRKLIRLKKTYLPREEFFKKWNKVRSALYETGEYQNFLHEVRTRAGFRCEKCPGNYRKQVHHKILVYDNPLLTLDPDNAEYLCLRCHNKEHAKEDGTRRTRSKRSRAGE